MVNASLTTGSALSLPSDTYIYSLARLQSSSNSAACIASPSSLVLFDSNSLSAVHHIRKCHTDSVTALVSAGSRFATAGRDGLVKLWDDRAKSESASTTLRGKDGVGFSAIAASCNLIAAGTENTRDGPGDVSVLVWDARSPGTALRTYADSHNDTITALTFHPTAASPLLLSSSTDALLTLFDTSQPDEDDAVAQVFNHSAAVHCASFLAPDEVAAISADEQLGVYQLLTPEAIANEDAVAASTQYGDVRPNLSAGYVVDLLRGASPNEPQTWVASGNLE
ncbi:hypothetical protein ANO11243_002600 [Dothideomycetidae sp. 11243]|nr:hypothetical protein ANO11243_002600 [fungal sp. No.11243]